MGIKTDATAGHITHHRAPPPPRLARNRTMARMQVLWTCSVLIAMLFADSHCVQKTTLTKNWGPQSMLYLKGKYGRRYVPDSDVDFYKSALKSLYAVIRDFEKMKSERARRSTRLFTAENLLIRYTE